MKSEYNQSSFIVVEDISCPDLFCLQYTYYRTTGELYIGGIKSHKYNDNRCLTDSGNKENEPGLHNCKEATEKGMGIYWSFTQVTMNGYFLLYVFDPGSITFEISRASAILKVIRQ